MKIRRVNFLVELHFFAILMKSRCEAIPVYFSANTFEQGYVVIKKSYGIINSNFCLQAKSNPKFVFRKFRFNLPIIYRDIWIYRIASNFAIF